VTTGMPRARAAVNMKAYNVPWWTGLSGRPDSVIRLGMSPASGPCGEWNAAISTWSPTALSSAAS
jgi:hypothetical protein